MGPTNTDKKHAVKYFPLTLDSAGSMLRPPIQGGFMTRSSGPRKTAFNLSELLHQQLNAYAVAAAMVSLLVLIQPSEARIVYTPTKVVINHIPYNLDLNHDGTTDFSIATSFRFAYPCRNGPWHEYRLWEMPSRGNGAVVAADGYAAALGKGVKIGSEQSFIPSSEAMAYVVSGWYLAKNTCFYQHGMYGDWANAVDRYLGLSFQIKGTTHYGWARLSVQVGYVYIHATLTGYAYETTPGKAIQAGQTKGAEDETMVNTESTIQEERAAQPLSLNPDKVQDDFLADKILFETLPGRCVLHFAVMTGYCITPSGGVCHSDYKPSFCPPGRRAKHIKTFQCGTEFAYVAARRTCP
jgi:hypothetical protein